MKKAILLFACAAAALGASAQDTSKSAAYIHRPVQVSFIAPMGTNGIEGYKVVNNISLNILTGYAAGLEGVEVGGLVNVELDYISGVQFAGLANAVLRNVNGAQFAGLVNFAGKRSKAAQFGGIANAVIGPQEGAQFGGIANYNHGIDGFQAAGIINAAIGDVDGAQVAGITNIADEIDGLQLSGILNVARRVQGAQISFINIADTVDGISLGFFSFVIKGYHKVELYANEAVYANVAFKTGTHRLYNIFSIGLRPADTSIWSFGYGLGTELKLTENKSLNLDLTANSMQRVLRFEDQTNLLNRLDATLSWEITEKAAVFAGPSFNVYVSHRDNPGDPSYINIAPYTFSEDHFRNTRVQTWLGLKAGVRIF